MSDESMHRPDPAGPPARPLLHRAAAAAVSCLVLLSCDRSPPGTDRAAAGAPRADNVVLISIDSLRADHLGLYGYRRPTSPTLDALGAKGLVFDRAYSTTSWTLPSHTAMFTGLDDRAHGVRVHKRKLGPEVPTLAGQLAENGVTTVGFYSGPYLHPTFGLSRGFDAYVNCSSVLPEKEDREVGLTHFASFEDVTNPIILEKLRAWSQDGPIGERNFVFIHMWDVHYAYAPPQRYVDLFDPDYRGDIDGRVYDNDAVNPGMDRRDLEHLIARYDGEIRYTDDTIAEILEILASAGLDENTSVIVVSDHGDEFFEHNDKGHHSTLYEEVLHVPLILYLPGRSPAQNRIDRVVSLIDLYPTVCELLGVPCEEPGGPGESLLAFFTAGNAVASRNDALADLSIPSLLEPVGIVTADGKALRWHGSAASTLPTIRGNLPEQPIPLEVETGRDPTLFFDRAALAEEQRGVFVLPDAAPEAALRAASRLEARIAAAMELRREREKRAGNPAAIIDEETERRLRALGYME